MKFTLLQVLLPYYEGAVYAVTNQRPPFHERCFRHCRLLTLKYYMILYYIIMCKYGACIIWIYLALNCGESDDIDDDVVDDDDDDDDVDDQD